MESPKLRMFRAYQDHKMALWHLTSALSNCPVNRGELLPCLSSSLHMCIGQKEEDDLRSCVEYGSQQLLGPSPHDSGAVLAITSVGCSTHCRTRLTNYERLWAHWK